MIVAQNGEVREERTKGGSGNDEVFAFVLAPEQLQQLKALLDDPALPQSGNDSEIPVQFLEGLDQFAVEYYRGDTVQRVKGTTFIDLLHQGHRAQRPLKNVEKWFQTTGAKKRDKTLSPNNCSKL